jgi:hypothetical protein
MMAAVERLWERCGGIVGQREEVKRVWLVTSADEPPVCVLPGFVRGAEYREAMVALCLVRFLLKRLGEDQVARLVEMAMHATRVRS